MLTTLRKAHAIYREGTRLDWIVWGANTTGAIIVSVAYFIAHSADNTAAVVQIASSGF